jgi:hypothetical protein
MICTAHHILSGLKDQDGWGKYDGKEKCIPGFW